MNKFESLQIEKYLVCKTENNQFGVKQDNVGFVYVSDSLLSCILFACDVTDILPGTVLSLFVTGIQITESTSEFVTVGEKYSINPHFNHIGFTLFNDFGRKHSFGWVSRKIKYEISDVRIRGISKIKYDDKNDCKSEIIEPEVSEHYSVMRLNWFIRLLNFIRGKRNDV